MNYKHNKPYYEIQFSELKDEKINVLSFEGKEKISDLFEYQIRIISDNPALDSSKLLNKSATFIFNRGDEDPIKIYGIISHFEQYGKSNEYAFYKVTLVPKLWLLNLVYQNEIYQNVNIEKIIEMVLDDAGLSGSDFKIDFKNTYPENEFIVQYRETNFNFLNRRLEHYGIYYYFDHKNDKDVVVFTDTNQNLPDIGSTDPICLNLNKDPLSEKESIFEISCREKIVTGMVQLKDYNYLFPEKQLLAQSQINSDDPGLYYDFGDNYCDESQGEFLAKVRNHELNCQRKIFSGTSDCRLFRAGYKFEMDNHYRQDWNDEYILTSVTYKGNQNSLFAFLPQQRKYEPTFECTFEAIPFSIEFKPERRTPIPKITGIMSAKIQSGSGDEYAFVDDQGRYKAKMLFDLSDKSNGEATLPIRLTQSYSGPGYGIHFPNHSETELLWSCVDGNPDRPIGLGTVPNPSNSSPSSSGNKSQSVIRTAGQNELSFEDKTGSENIYLFGTKDWTINITNDKSQSIGNNESLSVGNNRSKSVGNDQSETISKNKTIQVGADHSEDIGGNMSLTVSGNRNTTIGKNKSESIGEAADLNVGKSSTENIGENKTESVGKDESQTIGKNKSVSVGSNFSETVGKNYSCEAGDNISFTAGKDFSSQSGKKMSFSSGNDFAINGGKKGTISIADQLSIKCGKASITLKKNGDILINGKKINIKGSGDIIIKGKKILEN